VRVPSDRPIFRKTQACGPQGPLLSEPTAACMCAEDLISAVQFDQTGDYLATGDRGGRVVIFESSEVAHRAAAVRAPISHAQSCGRHACQRLVLLPLRGCRRRRVLRMRRGKLSACDATLSRRAARERRWQRVHQPAEGHRVPLLLRVPVTRAGV
jgi:hypothetical protein